jgi:phage terminase large subunit GpA-like protein
MRTKKIVNDYSQYENQLLNLIDFANVQISNILPSDWAEKNRVMTADVSSIPGKFSFENSPYTREIVNCVSSTHPAKRVAVMKGAQIGFSVSVIENAIGWIIVNDPGNILFLVGHEDLVSDASEKVDRMIDSTGIRHMIKSTTQRAKNQKTGDTDTEKMFPEGKLKIGIANHKMLRNISIRYGFIDDYESMRGDSKQSGSTRELIEQRFSSFAKNMKLFYISTPELKEKSNIEPVYLLGDQRKYFIPCPCCGDFITIEWKNIVYDTDENGSLISGTTGYKCPSCDDVFDDRDKSELIKLGEWRPTAKPSEPDFYSYHISALYAPTFMFNWEHYVRQYLEANPVNGRRNEAKHKTFVNLVLGETYEQEFESASAVELMNNIRDYEIGTIPEKLSIRDGNGRIVMITLGSDLNGKEDDARLDYEILAHSESGATYSIIHGSIGTFVNKDTKANQRAKWTYRRGVDFSVWVEFDKIIKQRFVNDNTGDRMSIFFACVDSGYMHDYAYKFVADQSANVVALKGEEYDKPSLLKADRKVFKQSMNVPKLYLVESNYTKDMLNDYMGSVWNPQIHKTQPMGFMNYPQPSRGLYGYKNYFSHFEAEHKVVDDKTHKFVWKKRNQNVQNHLFDCRLYALVARDIFIDRLFKAMKVKNGTWNDYVKILNSKK